MGLFNWFLDAAILALNVLALAAPASVAIGSYMRQRLRLAVWEDQAPWLPYAMGLLNALIVIAVTLGIYYAGYRFFGFPSWMRWLVG